MAIEEKTWVEQVVIGISPDGHFVRAHQSRITALFRDGEEMSDHRRTVAEPLDVKTLAAVLPDHAALLAENAAFIKQIAQLSSEKDAIANEAAASAARAAERIATLEKAVAAHTERIEELVAPKK